jgi:hypothetical protein
VGHVVRCGTSGARNIDALFFILEWDQCGFQKRAAGHVMLNLRFCILWICGSGSAFRHVRAGNIDALFFVLRWSRCGFLKKCGGTCYAELVFLHPVESADHAVHSDASEV